MMVSRTFSSLAWGKADFFATPAEVLLWTQRARVACSGVRASALPLCGLIMIGMDCWTFSFAIMCEDRKSTRLNSSHLVISYAVFCLKKKEGAWARRDVHRPGTDERPHLP